MERFHHVMRMTRFVICWPSWYTAGAVKRAVE